MCRFSSAELNLISFLCVLTAVGFLLGLPNVGKSSIINSLKRSKACLVGATPGITKSMQEVALDSKIILLDSPGMVLAAGNMSDSSVALRNAIKVESLTDPITPVEAILRRTNKEYVSNFDESVAKT